MMIVRKLLKKENKKETLALSKFCKFPTSDNLNHYRIFRAKARQTIKSTKRKSWRTYVSNLNNKTPIKKVWDMVRKISGKSKSASYHHLNTNFNNATKSIAPLWLVWVRTPHGLHVGQVMFYLRVCQVVFPGVLPFSPHLLIGSSRYE